MKSIKILFILRKETMLMSRKSSKTYIQQYYLQYQPRRFIFLRKIVWRNVWKNGHEPQRLEIDVDYVYNYISVSDMYINKLKVVGVDRSSTFLTFSRQYWIRFFRTVYFTNENIHSKNIKCRRFYIKWVNWSIFVFFRRSDIELVIHF